MIGHPCISLRMWIRIEDVYLRELRLLTDQREERSDLMDELTSDLKHIYTRGSVDGMVHLNTER